MAQQPQYGYGYGYGYAAANYGAQTTNFAAAAAAVRPQLAGQQQATYPTVVAQVAPAAGFTATETSVAPVQQQQQQQQQQQPRQQTPGTSGA